MTIIYIILAFLLGLIIGILIGSFLMKLAFINEINKQIESKRPILNSLICELDELIDIVKSSKSDN